MGEAGGACTMERRKEEPRSRARNRRHPNAIPHNAYPWHPIPSDYEIWLHWKAANDSEEE